MPQRMFEIDNVVELDDSAETGAAEYRKVALAEIGRESGFATARSVVDAMLRELGWQAEYKAVEHPTFVPGRAAEVSMCSQPIGVVGEVHPEVLSNFGLTYPVALAELTLQRVC
jgi:phenylalanyl-tRNA synthetase beta chain